MEENKIAQTAENKDKKGYDTLVGAIFSAEEPEEIADVPMETEEEEVVSKKKSKKKAEPPQKSKEERLSELIQKGRKAGKLTYKEIAEVLETMNLSTEQLDKFYEGLEELGIETSGEELLPMDETLPALDELDEIEEVTEEETHASDRY